MEILICSERWSLTMDYCNSAYISQRRTFQYQVVSQMKTTFHCRLCEPAATVGYSHQISTLHVSCHIRHYNTWLGFVTKQPFAKTSSVVLTSAERTCCYNAHRTPQYLAVSSLSGVPSPLYPQV